MPSPVYSLTIYIRFIQLLYLLFFFSFKIQVIQDDQRARGGIFLTNQRGLVPPLVTTHFLTQDQGNASPRYIRSTMYTIPTTADIIKQVKLLGY